MSNAFIKSLLTHGLVILIFIAIISFFFYPFWQGKSIPQGDLTSWEGASKEILVYNKTHSDKALWTNAMFGGMPTYQIALAADSNLLQYVQNILTLGFLKGPIATFFLCAISFYLLYLTLGLGIPLSAVGAVSTLLVTSNFLLWEAGHLTKLIVLATSGFIISGILLSYKGELWKGGALFALGAGINILNNHVQMSYYLFLSIAPLIFLYAYQFIKEKNWKGFLLPSASLSLIAILAILSTGSTILPTIEFSTQTMRGAPILEASANVPASSSEVEGLEWGYAMSWSNNLLDVAAGIIPGIVGGGGSEYLDKSSAVAKDLRSKGYNVPKKLQAPLYWGALPFTGGPFYFGAIICFLFVLGIMMVKGPVKWWLCIAVILGIIISLGKNFSFINRLIFDYLPLYNKFRAPSSMISVTSYFIPILGFLGLYSLIRKEYSFDEFKRKLYIALGITGGICLFFALLGPSFFSFSSASDPNYAQSGFTAAALEKDRMSLMQSDAFRSLGFILLGAAVLYFFAKGKINQLTLSLVLGVLILVDLGGVARRYVHWDSFVKTSTLKKDQKPRPVDMQILQDKSYHRILDLTVNTFNSAIPSFHHKHVGGYHAAKLQRIQDLIDRNIQPEISMLSTLLQSASQDSALQLGLSKLQVLNMLNTKYFILGQPGKEMPLLNTAAFGPAWFVQKIQFVESANEEIDGLKSNDLKQTAVVNKEFQASISTTDFDAQGTITLVEYSPNKISYTTNSSSKQFAVFSEIWYGPDLGWNITIDGKPSKLIRANYGLRSAEIPAGQHEIVMEFHPKSYFVGKIVSTICSSLLVFFMAWVCFREYKTKRLIN